MNTATNPPSALKLRRLSAGLTLEEIAKETGIDPSNLSRIERGRLALTGRRLEKLAEFYKVPAETLLKEVA